MISNSGGVHNGHTKKNVTVWPTKIHHHTAIFVLEIYSIFTCCLFFFSFRYGQLPDYRFDIGDRLALYVYPHRLYGCLEFGIGSSLWQQT